MASRFLLLATIFLFFLFPAKGQQDEARIELGPTEIALNEAFTISVTVENSRLRSLDNFPDIPGFVKSGTSSSSSTNIINGKMTQSQSIIQNYVAEQEGAYTLKDFTMKVNGTTISSPGQRIKVGPPRQRRAYDPFAKSPWEDFFGGSKEEKDFVDIKDELFLALTTDKDEVYKGEGFNTTLSLYVPEDNRASFKWFELGEQLNDILKKIKPANCWEESFNVTSIEGKPVTIQKKRFTQYPIYKATFFPNNTKTIHFPAVGLKMVKFKEARNSPYFGPYRKEAFKTFYSKAKTVKVKDLPEHPAKNRVSVGEYKLEEAISSSEVKTGESLQYTFKITGRGDIHYIQTPMLPESDKFDFYKPQIKTNISRRGGTVSGYHSMDYQIIPNEPGTYNWGDYFNWVYFNPRTEKYETLASKVILEVSGESKKNEYILANDMGSFYDTINDQDNQLISRQRDEYIKIFANIFILLMLVLTAVFIFRK